MLSPFSRPIPAALLVDFDNVVSKLLPEFAENPLAWVRWLEAGGHEPGHRRRFLIKRVYWNAHNEVYRKTFEAAGFEAFACRSEAKSKSSTADIVLALDAMQALASEDRIQEFVLLTTDTDFVPLVDRIVEYGRKSVVLVDERDVSSAVYRERADLVITRDALGHASQLTLEAYKTHLTFWGPVTAGPFPVVTKTPRKVRKARARSEPALIRAAELVAADLMGRSVRRMEHDRLPRLLARFDDFTMAGSESDRWLGWGDEETFIEELAQRNPSLAITRTRRGAPQLELSEEAFQHVRNGGGPGFDLVGAAAEVARIAAERPGQPLNRARVTKLLAGFPTFTTSGARPFMGCTTYRNFIKELVEKRTDLRLNQTPDGGATVVYEAPSPQPVAKTAEDKGRNRNRRRGKGDDGATPMMPSDAAMVKG